MLQLRLMEKRREPVCRDDVDILIDQIAGTVLTHLSSMSARCSQDMQVRLDIDAVVMLIRREISEVYSKMADEWGEPPLNDDAWCVTRETNGRPKHHRAAKDDADT